MKKSTWLIILACLLVATGGYLLAGRRTDDTGLRWKGAHLAFIQEQLNALADELRRYHEIHGRYPTNDEGLGALEFDARFSVPSDLGSNGEESGLFSRELAWQIVAEGALSNRLAEYRTSHHHPPRNAAEFTEMWGLGGGKIAEPVDPSAPVVDLAISRDDHLFLLREGMVLSPWYLPYGYENRRGMDASLFAGSPADDGDGRYVLKVDEGIYVYSVGGQLWADEYDYASFHYHKWFWIGGGMFLVALVLVLVATRSARRIGEALLMMGGFAILGLGAGKLFQATCYAMAGLFHRRDEQAVARQRELLTQFRDRGVITPDTYARAMTAIDKGPVHAPKPATQPDEQ